MATNTFKTFLMKGTSASSPTYTKLIDIKDYPDLGSAPENLETTTCSDPMKTYIPGLQDVGGGLEFTCNYTLDDYTTLKALENTETPFAVWFGGTQGTDGTVTPTGTDGKWKFKGKLSVFVSGAGTNAVREMKVSIMPSTPVTADN